MEDLSAPKTRLLHFCSIIIYQRPASAIRPLSGRVFMRRMEHGWVAKHYPTDQPPITSLTNISDDLDDDDDSDCDSLDSFFNEEFDDREKSEKLQDLLSCNTYGVESKSHKRDWIAGEVGIPKFHCPRCRDHWYGLTPFPCNEELARLIRDGLWYTGKGDSGKFNMKTKSGGWTGSKGGTGSGSPGGGGAGDSSEQKPKRILKGNSSENGSYELGRGKQGKKNRRKITFKLDDENGSGEHKSGSGGDSLGNSNSNTLAGNKDEHHRLNSENSTNGGTNGTNGANLLNGVEPSSNSRGNGLDPYNNGLLGNSDFSNSAGKGRGGRSEGFNDERMLSSKTNRGLLSEEAGMGLLNSLEDSSHLKSRSGDKNGHAESGGCGSTAEQREDAGASDQRSEAVSHDLHDGGIKLQQASVSLVTSSTNAARKTSDSAGPDYGRKVRKSGGYMKASSPTSSEWGDPSHARHYASSTVPSSQTGSTSNLHKDKALPPIVPPIRKPRVDFLGGGFDLTPAWRYSYFSPSPLHIPAARQTATTAPPRKKK
ncbi:hypothetical protein GBAR_LOCUS10004 [Geodia barretti]|uniref:Uncharacterized protein n=1 Tax=Geodia barretti TaxID=519541 RepID=A0AA35RRB5_GEOBA|nr:hypothetical protein GBAR_LOCUS10004 [Geodia barretti]